MKFQAIFRIRNPDHGRSRSCFQVSAKPTAGLADWGDLSRLIVLSKKRGNAVTQEDPFEMFAATLLWQLPGLALGFSDAAFKDDLGWA